MDFRGFDSNIILSLGGGIPRPTGDFPESLSQAMLVGVMLVGRLGVPGGPNAVWARVDQRQALVKECVLHHKGSSQVERLAEY